MEEDGEEELEGGGRGVNSGGGKPPHHCHLVETLAIQTRQLWMQETACGLMKQLAEHWSLRKGLGKNTSVRASTALGFIHLAKLLRQLTGGQDS